MDATAGARLVDLRKAGARCAARGVVVAALPQGAPAQALRQPPALTAAQLRPVAAAVAAAGATTRRVEVLPGPVVGGPFGPGAAQILVDLTRTTLPLGDELVAAAVAAAGANGLFVESVGGGFEPADCDGLLGEAREAAAADARRRAEGVATAFGVEVGDLLLASEAPFYDGGGGFGCGTLVAGGTQGGTYFPPFDPSVPPTVRVYAQINASYAILA